MHQKNQNQKDKERKEQRVGHVNEANKQTNKQRTNGKNKQKEPIRELFDRQAQDATAIALPAAQLDLF